MRVQTFVGRLSTEALRQMDEHINQWLESHKVEPRFVTQTFGQQMHREVTAQEPVVITSIWY